MIPKTATPIAANPKIAPMMPTNTADGLDPRMRDAWPPKIGLTCAKPTIVSAAPAPNRPNVSPRAKLPKRTTVSRTSP